MITAVFVSNGRIPLLKRTLASFFKFNTAPLAECLLIDDSANASKQLEIIRLCTEYNIVPIMNMSNMGEVKSIDKVYEFVNTDWIFHCEDDWEFYRSGFIEKSMAVMRANHKLFTVWLRELNDTNTHPVETDKTYCIYDTNLEHKITDYYLMATGALGGNWNGFTWNPGLRRLSDYKLVAPFSKYIEPGDFAALTECRIDNVYHKQYGFRAAILPEGYCQHIG